MGRGEMPGAPGGEQPFKLGAVRKKEEAFTLGDVRRPEIDKEATREEKMEAVGELFMVDLGPLDGSTGLSASAFDRPDRAELWKTRISNLLKRSGDIVPSELYDRLEARIDEFQGRHASVDYGELKNLVQMYRRAFDK